MKGGLSGTIFCIFVFIMLLLPLFGRAEDFPIVGEVELQGILSDDFQWVETEEGYMGAGNISLTKIINGPSPHGEQYKLVVLENASKDFSANKGDLVEYFGYLGQGDTMYVLIAIESSHYLKKIEEPLKTQTPTPTPLPPFQKSNTLLYTGLFVAVLVLILAIYTVTKRKPERELKEAPIEKKLEEKPKSPTEEISSQMKKLLEEKGEWREKLDKLKNQKEILISEGVMTEKTYQDRYEEIMNQLVDIEDKIIQEKMKKGVKK